MFMHVLEESLDLIRKLALKPMLLCLFYQDLLVWVPRSMFSNSWHEISDFINISFDLCIHSFIISMFMFLMFLSRGEPRFSPTSFTLECGPWDHTSARECGTSAKTWLVPSMFYQSKNQCLT